MHSFEEVLCIMNGDGKELLSFLYPVKYFNESLPYDFLSDNAILLISTSLLLAVFLFLWKLLLIIPSPPSYTVLVPFFIQWEEKKSGIFI